MNRIREAYQRREALHADPQTTTYRLFHGYSEGMPGLAIDRYDDVAVIESKGADSEALLVAFDALRTFESFSCIIAKERGEPPKALLGTLPGSPAVVLEEGLRYQVETWAPRNPGIYLDARPARSWLRDNSEGRRILNLFSFAGSLGVASMAGGALGVTHVDTQKRALRRCEENHRLNDQAIGSRDLQRQDVRKMLRQAVRSSRRFGGVIVDPPPAVAGNALTPMSLAPLLSKVIAPGGWVLCFFHHDSRSWDVLEAATTDGLGWPSKVIWRGRSGSDFPESSPERDLRLSVLASTA